MRADELKIAEQKLDGLASMAAYHQGFWLVIMLSLLAFNPSFLKEAGQYTALSALLSSFIASRIYLQAGQKLEELKKFSSEEAEERKREYSTKFLAPYPLWIGCFILFKIF